MNTQAVVFGAVLLFASYRITLGESCAYDGMLEICKNNFYYDAGPLAETIQEGHYVDKQKLCKVIDDFISCAHKACDAYVPQDMIDIYRSALKQRGIECGASTALSSLLLLFLAMLLVTALRE